MKRVMTFGTNEFFECIGAFIQNPDDLGLQKRIYDVVKKESCIQLYKMSYHEDDFEDIIQEIELRVFKSLFKFYEDSIRLGRTERERNSWLLTIAYNTCVSYSRKPKAAGEYTVVSIETVINLPDEESEVGCDSEETKKLSRALEDICRINTSVGYILSFILLAIRKENTNSKPSELIEEIAGLTLGEIYGILKTDIKAMGFEAAAHNALCILDERMAGRENDIFDAFPRTLTDKSNWMRKKIKENRSR